MGVGYSDPPEVVPKEAAGIDQAGDIELSNVPPTHAGGPPPEEPDAVSNLIAANLPEAGNNEAELMAANDSFVADNFEGSEEDLQAIMAALADGNGNDGNDADADANAADGGGGDGDGDDEVAVNLDVAANASEPVFTFTPTPNAGSLRKTLDKHVIFDAVQAITSMVSE
jgi:hypothetical protein